MLRLRSARDLGLTTRWRYGFLPYASSAASTPGVVYVDIGANASSAEAGPAPGLIDHHHPGSRYASSAGIVAARPDLIYNHLMNPWLQRFDDGRLRQGTVWEPLIVTHDFPDWDSAAASVLIEYWIEHGQLPARTKALVEYVNAVDQGCWRMRGSDDILHPHLAMLLAAHRNGKDFARTFETGCRLVHAFLEGQPDWPDRFPELIAGLREQCALYAEDKRNADLIDRFVVPAVGSGERLELSAFLLNQPSRCELNKYFVRAEGYPFFLCPYKDGRGGADVCIVSLDDAYVHPSGQKPTLRGLGYRLEQAESRAREARDGRDSRPGPPRWGDAAYSQNADPWYDGRDRNYTIVQSPNSGTALSISEIRAIVEQADYSSTSLVSGELSLLWVDALTDHSLKWQHLGGNSCAGASPRKAGRTEFRVEPLIPVNPLSPGTASRWRGPAGLNFLLVRLSVPSSISGATFEQLVQSAEAWAQFAGRPWDYTLAHVQPFANSDPDEVQRMLRRLGAGALHLLPHSKACLMNAHHVLHAIPGHAEDLHGPLAEAHEHEFAALLYAAYLRESVARFSDRMLPGGVGLRDQQQVRKDFIDFQRTHYRRRVDELPERAQGTFEALLREMDLPGLYEEVHSQLDRLGEMEQSESQRKFELLAMVLSVLSLLQTITSYFALNYAGSNGDNRPNLPLLLALSAGVPALVLTSYFRFVRKVRSGLILLLAGSSVIAIAIAAWKAY